jgi:hypothetical protein
MFLSTSSCTLVGRTPSLSPDVSSSSITPAQTPTNLTMVVQLDYFPATNGFLFYGAFIDQEMRVRGRYTYIPEYADRPISVPPKWRCWITDAPDDGNGGVGESSRDSGYESSGDSGDGGYDKEDDGEYAGDDLSATVVLTRSRQSDTQGGHDNSAENSFQVNAHRSVSRTP